MFFKVAKENNNVIYIVFTKFLIKSQELIYLTLNIEHKIFKFYKNNIQFVLFSI